MVINFHNPGILLIGGIAAAAVCLIAFRLRIRQDIRKGLRVANTERLKRSPLYKKTLLKIRILKILSAAGIILSVTASLFLTARPYQRITVKESVNRRDIYLCIDLSPSNSSGVKDLVEAFRETVAGLEGDRIGISLFNTSSQQYVPMTDDYSFVLKRLDELAEYLAAAEEFSANYTEKYNSVYDIPDEERARYEELNRILASFDEGITAGYALKGTSAVGEGLASCLFSFPELASEQRTRLILFITDNHPELIDDPLVTLPDAAKMCQYDKVPVYGIYPIGKDAPSYDPDEAGGLREAVEMTGGKFYEADSALTAEEILADIHSLASVDTNTATASIDTDMPAFWSFVLIAGIALLAGTTAYYVFKRGLRRGSVRRRRTALVLLLFMIAGTAAIVIRPMYLSPEAEIMTNNLDVAFVVDTTISMWAEDHGTGKRMDGVRQDIRKITEALPGSYFSLIRFDNGAQVLMPFTQDLNALDYIMEHIDMPAYATATGSSLNTAYEALRSMLESASLRGKNRRTVVFLFSDGETTDGSELRSFEELSALINNGAVLGYGTAGGGRMNYPGKGYIKDYSTGKDALSRMDEASLRQLADDLNLPYTNRSSDLPGALDARLQTIRLMSRDAAFKDGDRTGYNETYHYFAGAVFVLLLVWLFLTIYRGGVT